MPKTNKQTNKQELEKKNACCCEDKSLVVKIDIIIVLSYFVEKVFLNFILKVLKLMQSFSSFGKLLQTDSFKKEMQC